MAKKTLRVCSSVAAGNWSLAVIEQGLTCWAAVGAKNLKNFTNHMQIGVPTADRMLTRESANQQRRVPISNRRAGLEVLGERDVSWKESRHEARQEFSGASVIEVLLLPELSRDERE